MKHQTRKAISRNEYTQIAQDFACRADYSTRPERFVRMAQMSETLGPGL
ncbi:MAG: hypothetical protein LUQ29_14685 [Methylococcaceae bacterium]|nr:hypothetical protein [Methylococcaceae bacterium]